jgi:hypothetical protein
VKGSRRMESSRLDETKLLRPCLKNKIQKRAGGMAQVVEQLPSMLETLGSIVSTRKKKKKEKAGGSEGGGALACLPFMRT